MLKPAKLTSPVPWVGGKARKASNIVDAFPTPSTYKVFVELFAGSLSILLAKPKGNHMEIINDKNEHLMNFWMQLRDDHKRLQWELQTLPYSQSLYRRYSDSLRSEGFLDDLERAVRWFYVQRAEVLGRSGSGTWSFSTASMKLKYGINGNAVAYQNAVASFPLLVERLKEVQMPCMDYLQVLRYFDSPETLFYADPPYIGSEAYYGGPFDHEGLAKALNAAQGKIVLSYQAHDDLEELYPADKWRRVRLNVTRNTANFNQKKEKQAKEVLLCNFEQEGTLF